MLLCWEWRSQTGDCICKSGNNFPFFFWFDSHNCLINSVQHLLNRTLVFNNLDYWWKGRVFVSMLHNHPPLFCLNILFSDCYRGNGRSYMGNLSKTRFGLTCSTWDKNIEDLRRCVHIKEKEMVQWVLNKYCLQMATLFHLRGF